MAVRREQVIQTAEKYVSRGKIEAAIREYRKVLAENPKDISTLNRVGDLYARLDRIDEAIALFLQLAEHYTEDGFFVKAIAIYKKIIKLDPTRLEIYEKLAQLYHKQGLVNEARTQYQVLADYYLKHDNTASAINIYRQMAELEPENPSHHVKLADLYQREELVDKAMGEYRIIAELMLRHGHAEEARRVYEKALDLSAADVGFVTDAVLKLKEANRIGDAARLLAVAVERNPAMEKVARLVGMEREAEPVTEEMAPTDAGVPADTQVTPEPQVEQVEEELTLDEEVLGLGEAAEEVLSEDREEDLQEAEAEAELTLTQEELEAAADFGAGTPPEVADHVLEELGPAGTPKDEVQEPAAEEVPPEEMELSLDEVFVLDLDSDEVSPHLVTPPPDMLQEEAEEAPPREAESLEEAGTPSLAPDLEALQDREEPPTLQEPREEEAPESQLELEPEPAEAPAEPPDRPAEEVIGATGAGRVQIDPEVLERTAAELRPDVELREEELLSEAEVLAKYGLRDKALERLTEILKGNPNHLGAYSLLITLHLEDERHTRVVSLANQVAAIAREQGDVEIWGKLRRRLERAGYQVEDDQVVAAPESLPASEAAPDHLLQEILSEEQPPPLKSHKVAPRSLDDSLAATLDAIASEVLEGPRRPRPMERPQPPGKPEAPQPEAEAPSPPPPSPPEEAGEEEGALEDLTLPWESAPELEPTEAPGEEGQALGWLEEMAAPQAGETEESLFADEEQFFDLAAELERELQTEEGSGRGEALVEATEQSLETIVEGFKRGVAEHLAAEDYDTHYNLGIAYREMGLLDEAIGEFQLAAKDPRYLVDCSSMLGLCFLDKGLPELAVKWYQRGLSAPELTEEQTLGLLYDLGNVYLAMGDSEAAYRTFVEIYGINTNYRDVVAKLEELGRGR